MAYYEPTSEVSYSINATVTEKPQYPRLQAIGKWFCIVLVTIFGIWWFSSNFSRLDQERIDQERAYEAHLLFDAYL